MRKVRGMLGEAIEQTDILRNARALLVLRNWPSIVGEGLAKRCAPDRFERGVLWVAAEGSAWAQEIRMNKGTIMKRINDAAQEDLCQDVRVGVRPFQAPVFLESKPTPTPDPIGEDVTIQEIAARRLRKWKDATGD